MEDRVTKNGLSLLSSCRRRTSHQRDEKLLPCDHEQALHHVYEDAVEFRCRARNSRRRSRGSGDDGPFKLNEHDQTITIMSMHGQSMTKARHEQLTLI